MNQPAASSNPKPPGDGARAASDSASAPSMEEQLYLTWKKHGSLILVLCAAVLLAILVWGARDFFHGRHEIAVENEYAAAATPDQLKAFAAAHPGDPLAGLAQLRLADEAYVARRFPEAIAAYDAAAGALEVPTLRARARLGAAMARLSAGRTAEGQAALQALFSDAGQLKAVRAEAGYHLATLASDAGRTDEVSKLASQLMQIDPASPWTQRALLLRPPGAAPAASAAPPAAGGPVISLPGVAP